MSDLINRKEAIELLTSRVLSSIGIFGDLGGAVSGARELIRAMPSAEPEEEVFEWCHDCKEYDQNKHCCHRWTKVIRQTIEEMKAESERKWIPVTEALPEEETDVLVTVHFDGHKSPTVDLPPSDYVEIASHVDGLWSSLSDEYKVVWKKHHVVAWMPVIEPYRGE